MSAEISENNHDLIPSSNASCEAENGADKTWANELDTLLGRVSEGLTREIENFKDESELTVWARSRNGNE